MKFFIEKRKNNLKGGFTLIETFVAITILIISIVGPLTLVMKGLSVSKTTKAQITAMYLAQDGMEYIRNIRDENILTGNNWLLDLDDCVSGKCIVETSDYRNVDSCSTICSPLNFNSTSKIYGYASIDPPTVFTRTININEINPSQEVLVTVTMDWNEGPNLGTFVIEEHMLNWQ